MSLLSRAVLLIALVVLSISLGQGVAQLLSPEPSPLDELVAARNERRAIAYRFVDLRGGRVGTTAADAAAAQPTNDVVAEGNPGSEINPNQSLIAVELNEYVIVEDELRNKIKDLLNGSDGREGLDKLREDIKQAIADRRMNLSSFKAIENDILLATTGIHSRYTQIKFSVGTLLSTDYKAYMAMVEQEALRAEIASVQIDTARAKDQTQRLENENYETSYKAERVVKQIGRYETLDPTIASRSSRVANPWLRGLVTSVDPDPRVGELVISIGSQDGVQQGQVFSVQRNGEFVGHCRVEHLERNRARCVLTEDFRGISRVMANDRIAGVANFGQFEEKN